MDEVCITSFAVFSSFFFVPDLAPVGDGDPVFNQSQALTSRVLDSRNSLTGCILKTAKYQEKVCMKKEEATPTIHPASATFSTEAARAMRQRNSGHRAELWLRSSSRHRHRTPALSRAAHVWRSRVSISRLHEPWIQISGTIVVNGENGYRGQLSICTVQRAGLSNTVC